MVVGITALERGVSWSDLSRFLRLGYVGRVAWSIVSPFPADTNDPISIIVGMLSLV